MSAKCLYLKHTYQKTAFLKKRLNLTPPPPAGGWTMLEPGFKEIYGAEVIKALK